MSVKEYSSPSVSVTSLSSVNEEKIEFVIVSAMAESLTK